LDAVLDSLGRQVVPPEFYQTSSDSSLFGSQHGSDNEHSKAVNGVVCSGNTSVALPSPVSPSATLRGKGLALISSRNLGLDAEPKDRGKRQESRSRSRNEDRSYWKTLRDFVDDKSIEDALDVIESDRLALDVCLRLSCHRLLLNEPNRPY
jgi:autophagy-related protein 17